MHQILFKGQIHCTIVHSLFVVVPFFFLRVSPCVVFQKLLAQIRLADSAVTPGSSSLWADTLCSAGILYWRTPAPFNCLLRLPLVVTAARFLILNTFYWNLLAAEWFSRSCSAGHCVRGLCLFIQFACFKILLYNQMISDSSTPKGWLQGNHTVSGTENLWEYQ